MARVRSKDSTEEVSLRKRLWAIGLRYRKNDKSVFGCPDIVFKRNRLAIFVDGEFWHGKDYPNGRRLPRTNQDYWVNKIEKNIQRDRMVNAKLVGEGWTVIRFWSNTVKKDLEVCVKIVIEKMKSK